MQDGSARVQSFRLEHAINLVADDRAATNVALRQWWRAVQLDRWWMPTVEWLVDPDELARREAADNQAISAAVA